ncbi:MAG: FGGY family carbohydrate kinase [Halanaerobiales bacterium]
MSSNEPDNYELCENLLLPKDYIRYRFTGVAAMDYSDGAGTLLMDVKNKKWSRTLVNKLGIEKDILPPLVNSTDQGGKISEDVSQITGLDPGIPVIAGGADNACGAIGSGIIELGRAMVSIGSSGVVLAPSEQYQINTGGKLHLFNHAVSKKYY